MVTRRVFGTLTFLIVANGCASYRPTCADVLGARPFLRDNPTSYIPELQEAAREGYVYAQMSYNAYQPADRFRFADSISELPPVDRGYGFQATPFEVRSGTTLKEVVIAFRGTDGPNWQDWWYGNIGNKQYHLARELYREIRAHYPPGTKIVTTGHSLGGGLALHISTNEPYVDSYVFNSSYKRLWEGRNYDSTNYRLGFEESGEILRKLRGLQTNPTIIHNKGYSCTGSNNHSMYTLARCLTHVAAIQDNGAVASLALNRVAQCESTSGMPLRPVPDPFMPTRRVGASTSLR